MSILDTSPEVVKQVQSFIEEYADDRKTFDLAKTSAAVMELVGQEILTEFKKWKTEYVANTDLILSLPHSSTHGDELADARLRANIDTSEQAVRVLTRIVEGK